MTLFFSRKYLCGFLLYCGLVTWVPGQATQNPSPMVEHTRPHPRLQPKAPPGKRFPLELGSLYIPEKAARKKRLPLFIHFHGPSWILESGVAGMKTAAAIGIQIGSGSGVYAQAFQDPQRFGKLLDQAERVSGITFSPITLSGWSAGYGAIREILRTSVHSNRVQRVLLIDGLHTSYSNGKPGPLESDLEFQSLEVFLKFAKEAISRRKQMILTHSEIFPGTFASTTETTDRLIRDLGLRRRAVLRWGPSGTQQLSEVRQGHLLILGYAGNSAPDHVDQLRSLGFFLRLFK